MADPVDQDDAEISKLADELRVQLQMYIEEWRSATEREHQATEALEPMLRQLSAYAADLRKSTDARRAATRSLETTVCAQLEWLVQAAEARDGESLGHSRRVGVYAGILAGAAGLGQEHCRRIEASARLHDAGRAVWPDSILIHAGPLSVDQGVELAGHCSLADGLPTGVDDGLIGVIAKVVGHHHERWDGSGYPHGLAGERIPLEARIVQLADVYDTLRSELRYKEGRSHLAACQAILQGDGRVSPDHFAPALLEVFGQVEGRLERAGREVAPSEG